MRILHTSDWHLGKVTVREQRRTDHEAAFRSTLEIAKDFRPDLILHTGDLFDGSRPSYDDMLRAIEMLQELATIASVVVLCGNHDSGALFRLFRQLLRDNQEITFVDRAVPPDAGGILHFPTRAGERILLGAVPFIHANRFVKYFEDPATQLATYAERMRMFEKVIGDALNAQRDPKIDIPVFAAHVYVGGAIKSGTERRLHISDEYATDAEHIPTVAYAAFGHIHKPQALPGTRTGWYAGSLIQTDFGEVDEQKGAVLVEAVPGKAAVPTFVPIDAGRPLKIFRGTLAQLEGEADAYTGTLCKVTVKTETPTPQLRDTVEAILSKATVAEIVEDCAATRMRVVRNSETVEEPTYQELFREFLSTIETKSVDAERLAGVFDKVLGAVQTQQPAVFDLLEAGGAQHETSAS